MKNSLKKSLGGLASILCVTGIGYLIIFKTSIFMADIRPDHLKGDYVLKHDGLAKLEKAQVAHGMDQWQNCDSLVYLLKTEFTDKKAWLLISPVKADQITYTYVCSPGNLERSSYRSLGTTSNFYISKDEKGIYIEKENEKSYEEFGSVFLYRAVQHLIQFPYMMSSADIFEYMGVEIWNNKEYDLIFATWGSREPTLNADQYIIWINQETGLIDRFDATGRDLTPWAVAQVLFSYEKKEGITYPKTIHVRNKDSGEAIMNFEINDFQFQLNHPEPEQAPEILHIPSG